MVRFKIKKSRSASSIASDMLLRRVSYINFYLGHAKNETKNSGTRSAQSVEDDDDDDESVLYVPAKGRSGQAAADCIFR
jgi:hypothetical protein